MRCYLSFSNLDVFKGVALLEEKSTIQTEEADPQSTRSTPASTPEEEATMRMAREPTVEKRNPNKFPGWEKVLHPSEPVVAAGQIPPIKRSKTEALQLGRRAGLNPSNRRTEGDNHPTGTPFANTRVGSHLVSNAASQFSGSDGMPEDRPVSGRGLQGTPRPIDDRSYVTPGVATISASHIVKDEVTGVTYMDTVTNSVGRVALSGPEQETSAQGPTIQDITDLI